MTTALLDVGLSLFRDELLREGGTAMVYSYNMTAGEAVKSNQLVFVLDCFYYLVLRSREYTIKTSI